MNGLATSGIHSQLKTCEIQINNNHANINGVLVSMDFGMSWILSAAKIMLYCSKAPHGGFFRKKNRSERHPACLPPTRTTSTTEGRYANNSRAFKAFTTHSYSKNRTYESWRATNNDHQRHSDLQYTKHERGSNQEEKRQVTGIVRSAARSGHGGRIKVSISRTSATTQYGPQW